MKGEHAYPATPHQRMIWCCRVLAQPAGYDFPFFSMEWPMEEAAYEWESALIDMARELNIDFEDIASIDLPPHFGSINRALHELSGTKENWTPESFAQMPEWDLVRELARKALQIEGQDTNPPSAPVEDETILFVDEPKKGQA